VLFDLGGTLVDMRDFPGIEAIAARVGVSLEAETIAHWYAAMVAENDRLGSVWTVEGLWRRVIEAAAGTALAPNLWARLYAALSDRPTTAYLYSDVRLCLDRLRASGRPLGVLTNHRSERSAREILEAAGILDRFRAVVASGDEGWPKPDSRLFLRAVDRLGTSASETLYVGDLPVTDVRGAQQAGLQALWLHRDGTGFGEEPPEITSLAEVPDWIVQFEAGGCDPLPGTAAVPGDAAGAPQRPYRRP
jgi:HAD superfamily hydrolase (TIGR01509 family)